MRNNICTSGSVDNIDHNPSARTTKDSFHGTAVCLTQHPDRENDGEDRGSVVINPDIPKQKAVVELPVTYTNIYTTILHSKDIKATSVHGPAKPISNLIDSATASEFKWLEKVETLI